MSGADGMDFAEFVDTATVLVRAVLARVPEQWREGLLDDIDQRIQEPHVFLRNLVPVFTEDRIPITPAEPDLLARLMRYRHLDLAPIAQLNVVAGPGVE